MGRDRVEKSIRSPEAIIAAVQRAISVRFMPLRRMAIASADICSSGLVALLAAATLAACGDAPEEETNTGDEGTTAARLPSDFLPCIVSDAGGFDDKSFNQLSYEGLKKAAERLLRGRGRRGAVRLRDRLRAQP